MRATLALVGAFSAALTGASAPAAQIGPCQALASNPPGLPWDLDFRADEGVRVDHAALPKPFVDERGRVHLFFEATKPRPRQMYAVSTDGLTFDGAREERAEDLAYHPFRVRMPNGVWRMYGSDPRTGAVTSRTSGDGVTFSPDFGVRYTLQPDDRGWMGIHDEYVDGVARVVMLYLGDRDGLNNTRRAVSTDNGWTFTFDRGDVLGDADAARRAGPMAAYVDQKSVHLDGAARRLFAMKQGCAIYSFLTMDGDAYAVEPGWRVSIASWPGLAIRSLHDPVVVRLPDGRFRMYVAAALNEAEPRSVVLSATTPAQASPARRLY